VSTVHVLLPEGVHDPARPSGGNSYDRRVCAGLTALGWQPREHLVAGTWPVPGAAARAALVEAITATPDGSLVLVDGLVANAAPDVLVATAERLRLVVLVHMPVSNAPDGHDVVGTSAQERAVVTAAAAIITTSRWTHDRLIAEYGLDPRRIHVAAPGTDDARVASRTQTGGRLLCVATVAPHKGQDTLLAALAGIADLPWHCACVGPLDRNPPFVTSLARAADKHGISDRLCFTGTRVGAELDQAYAAADLVVLASRGESYGLVLTEALARGIPVVATAVGGVPEAVGRTSGGRLPGLLVPPGDDRALAAALRCWLEDAELRDELRRAALERRGELTSWAATAAQVAGVLRAVGEPGRRRARISG
jgi:glycosyltransferase involved in cell wall biosynthesis